MPRLAAEGYVGLSVQSCSPVELPVVASQTIAVAVGYSVAAHDVVALVVAVGDGLEC